MLSEFHNGLFVTASVLLSQGRSSISWPGFLNQSPSNSWCLTQQTITFRSSASARILSLVGSTNKWLHDTELISLCPLAITSLFTWWKYPIKSDMVASCWAKSGSWGSQSGDSPVISNTNSEVSYSWRLGVLTKNTLVTPSNCKGITMLTSGATGSSTSELVK